MATGQRDYYEVLGLSKTAGEAEIKKAFRRLARELHPDVSDQPGAEERFKEVVEAYEVLSSSERRELYDRYGHEGLRSRGFEPTFDFGSLSDLFSTFFGDDPFGTGGARLRRGADMAAEVAIDLVEAAHGATRRIPIEVAVTCEACAGTGAEPGSPPITCPACAGSGRLEQVSRTFFGEFLRTQSCPRCGGTGRVIEKPCRVCKGAGRVVEERALDVEIPAGIHDGQRIRISGEGHVGALGGRAGDLYLRVRVRPDPRFVREGNDIFSTADLTMTEAALGTSRTIPTLDGDVELEFEPGTQPGQVLLLDGAGMPVLGGRGRGDHRVLVNVAVPRNLDPEQRRLLEDFALREQDGTYRSDESFFDKLRSHFR
jgi:molecular chaperone DnaJ